MPLAKSRKSDTKGDILYDSTYRKFLERHISRAESRSVFSWGWESGVTIKMHKRALCGDNNVLNLNCGDGHTTV